MTVQNCSVREKNLRYRGWMLEGLVFLLLVGFVMLFLVRTIERIEQSYAKRIADGPHRTRNSPPAGAMVPRKKIDPEEVLSS